MIQEKSTDRSDSNLIFIHAIYYFTLVGIFISSFFPELRYWGINHWAYLPNLFFYILFSIGLSVPVLLHFYKINNFTVFSPENKSDSRTFWIVSFVIISILACSFYLFRAKTFFLGDGYQILSNLSSNSNHIKFIEAGESYIHLFVRNLWGDPSIETSILSYQSISIFSGILFLFTIVYFSNRLFNKTFEKILFLLSVSSSGYMLMFFGYVENYSLFILSVLIYTLIGLLIAKGKINKWVLVPALVAALFMHIMAVTLIPSTVYLLISKTKFAASYVNLKKKTKYIISFILLMGAGSIFIYFYNNNLFFRFSIVPILSDQFTIEGYTQFSVNHLLDILNLLLELFPGILIAAFWIYWNFNKEKLKQQYFLFFVVLIVSTLGSVFLFDPKLGMLRDWDLFSFIGVPISVFVSYSLVKSYSISSKNFNVIGLTIFLGAFLLFPRVYGQNSIDISETKADQIYKYDKLKSINFVIELKKYYMNKDNQKKLQDIIIFQEENYKHDKLNKLGLDLISQKLYSQALLILHKARDAHPTFFQAYLNLGIAHYESKNYDSAIYFHEIASGLKPGNHQPKQYLGYAYYNLGLFNKARNYLEHAIAINDSNAYPHILLSTIYKNTPDEIGYERELKIASLKEDAPLSTYLKLCSYYLSKYNFKLSAQYLKEAENRGMAANEIQELLNRYPQMKDHYKN